MFSHRYFLEYHDADRLHPLGFRLGVDSDVALLGRDPSAQVLFGDDTPTVSRRHAIIRLEGGQYFIEPLSRINSTLVNGRRILTPTPLHDGDEIRLSTDGPRLGFILGRGVQEKTPASTERRSRISPWLIVLCVIVLVALGFGAWKIADLTSANRRLDELVTQTLEQQQHQTDTATSPAQSGVMNYPYSAPSGFPEAVDSYHGSVDIPAPVPAGGSGTASESAMKAADKSVYYVMALGFEVTTPEGRHYEIECGNGEGQIPGWSGTGFLLSDGRFVTARHVVEPWFFLQGEEDSEMLTLNILASNGGKVVSYIGAVSPTGDKITFKSTDCRVNRAGDTMRRLRSGERVIIASGGTRDFATVQSGRPGGLPFSADASRNLRRGTKLTVLSFPLGLGANSYNDINPVYGTATVAADGLQDGMILTTETTYEKGSSGGPVFITDTTGRLVVVGITSAIAGRSTGFIEPISSIR